MASSLGKSERTTLRLKQYDDPLAEIEALKRKLASAKQELAALQSRLERDDDLPILRREAFRKALATPPAVAPMRGCLVKVCLANLSTLIEAHGDEAADAALSFVAQCLAGHVRQNDAVGRLGTGSFGILLAYADPQGAAAKMARLMKKIEELPCTWEGITLPITLSYSLRPLGADNALVTDQSPEASAREA